MTRIILILFIIRLSILTVYSQNDSSVYKLAQDFLKDSLVTEIKDYTISNDYKKLDFDFYKSNKGGLFIKSVAVSPELAMIIFVPAPNIDFKTFKNLGLYWIDKNGVYYTHPTSCGERIFQITNADSKTFEILDKKDLWAKDSNYVYYMGSKLALLNSKHTLFLKVDGMIMYAKDDNSIYCYNTLIDCADAKTFKVVENKDYHAIDKNNKYKFSKPID